MDRIDALATRLTSMDAASIERATELMHDVDNTIRSSQFDVDDVTDLAYMLVFNGHGDVLDEMVKPYGQYLTLFYWALMASIIELAKYDCAGGNVTATKVDMARVTDDNATD